MSWTEYAFGWVTLAVIYPCVAAWRSWRRHHRPAFTGGRFVGPQTGTVPVDPKEGPE